MMAQSTDVVSPMAGSMRSSKGTASLAASGSVCVARSFGMVKSPELKSRGGSSPWAEVNRKKSRVQEGSHFLTSQPGPMA